MQQVPGLSVENLPSSGYYVSKEGKKRDKQEKDPYIHKQGLLSDVRAGADKLTKDITAYFPKGFKGSKNSNFYEYLSMGIVPYIIGSAMLIALYSATNGKYNSMDGKAASNIGKRMGAGVVLYGLGKWLSKKIAHLGIYASTGINLDLKYKNQINQFPEPGQEKGIKVVQYPGVFDSADFPRKDLIALDNQLNHDNIPAFEDKILKKAGYEEEQNASVQTAWPLIRKVKVRTTALENISKYIAAATGVAIGFQEPFKFLKLKNIKSPFICLKDSIKSLWKGTNRNFATKHFGKALLIGTVISTLLTWLIPTIGFKTKPNTIKDEIDKQKEYEVA